MSTRTPTHRTGPTTTTPTTPVLTPITRHKHSAAGETEKTPQTMLNPSSRNIDISRSSSATVSHIFHSRMHTHAQSISCRLRHHCTQILTTHSRLKRKRRRDDINNNNSNINNNIMNYSDSDSSENNNNNNSYLVNNTPTNLMFPSTSDSSDYNNNNNNNYNSNCVNNNYNRNLSKFLTTTSSPAIQLLNAAIEAFRRTSTASSYLIGLLVALTTLCSFCAASPCDLNSWWDPLKDKCILCTVCEGDLIPLRPCQLHRDTICGSIYDLKIDWVVLAKTEPNWKERRKEDLNIELEQQLSHEELQQLQDGTLPMDWQTTALFMAVLACLFFFIIAAGILVHHMRQWRRMERRLDQDVEELSTKLMAKLAEVQSMDGGTFFIGNADALGVPTNFQPQHVLLPEKPAKHHERRILKTLQPGNVYIEENGSKG